MLPFLAGAAGAMGGKLLGSALGGPSEEDQRKQALAQLSQQYASQSGSPYGGAQAPSPEGPDPLAQAAQAGGSALLSGALADKPKPGTEEPEWWRSAARGALSNGALGGR